MRPLLVHVRESAQAGAKFLSRPGVPQPLPLRTTVHAGEDFAHLLTGLRHIHEAWRSWICGRATGSGTAWHLREDLRGTEALRSVGFPDKPRAVPPGVPRQKLLHDYLTDRRIFRNGRHTEWIDPRGEVDALNEIGEALRLEVARRGLSIEVNPTSNLLVGDLGDLTTHPLWRLAPPQRQPGVRSLAVTLGSDDPLVFNCRLPGEYQLLFDSMVLAGLTDYEALEWLEQVRHNGLERRFTQRIPVGDVGAEENPQAPPPFPL